MEPKAGASLKELQAYIHQVSLERGWINTKDLELFLLFTEEVGELAKAIRNHKGLLQEEGKRKNNPQELEGEFADVLCYILDLANRFGVDLDKALREKEAQNAGRKWN